MIWKLLGLQKKLDALFDDGWLSVGIATHKGILRPPGIHRKDVRPT